MRRNYAKDLNNSLMVARDEQGRIQSVQVNQEVQAKLYESLTQTIQRELKKAPNNKGLIFPWDRCLTASFSRTRDPTSP